MTLDRDTHLDGSPATTDLPYIKVSFQHGPPHEEGINGCRLEDVIDVLLEKLHDFQSRSLACAENDKAIYHLGLAKAALVARRTVREQQGVLGTATPHAPDQGANL